MKCFTNTFHPFSAIWHAAHEVDAHGLFAYHYISYARLNGDRFYICLIILLYFIMISVNLGDSLYVILGAAMVGHILAPQ